MVGSSTSSIRSSIELAVQRHGATVASHYSAVGNSGRPRRHLLTNARIFGVLATAGVVLSAAIVWGIAASLYKACTTWYQPKLHLRIANDGTKSFRILQLTDLHLGEAPYTDWGPEQDVKTFRLLHDLFTMEDSVDLVIFSGDQLTGNDVDANATVYYNWLGDLMDQAQMPYAMIFGNHDDKDFIANYPDGSTRQHPATTLRRALATADRRHRQSLTPMGPSSIFGVSNGVLSVWNPVDDSLALEVMLLDSGGGSLDQQILETQMVWYDSRRTQNVPAIAFQHIPTDQFQFNDDSCSGFAGEDGIAPLQNDPTSEISQLEQLDPNLLVLAVGHNHGNSYCCQSQTMALCFGRHSGYGGYGRWTRGARVFTFEWAAGSNSLQSWQTYVRLQYGNITDVFAPQQ